MKKGRIGKLYRGGAAAYLFILALSAGCTVSGRNGQIRRQPAPNLIFGSEQFDSPTAVNARSAWPSADGPYDVYEQVEYEEYITDYQGRGGRSDDFYRRRFQSVRTGTTRR